MLFLIRVAFWLSIVILVLPVSVPQKSADTPQVGAVDALSAAGAAFADFGQFCERQPQACAIGSQALSAFGAKAQASARWLYEIVTEQPAGQPSKTAAPAQPAGVPAPAQPQPRPGLSRPPAALAAAPQNTLTDSDRALPWRGPPARPVREARSGH